MTPSSRPAGRIASVKYLDSLRPLPGSALVASLKTFMGIFGNHLARRPR
jgi:hypothetical protein